MPTEFFPTLAALDDFIVPIIAVIMVISGIINSSREAKKAKTARARKRQSRTSGDSGSSISMDASRSELPTLEEIAEQRRRQLDSLSRKRSGPSSAPPGQSSRDAVAQEREAAKREYEARAEALRREKAEAAAQSRATEQRRQQAEELRRRQEQAQREQAARARRQQQQQRPPAKPTTNRGLQTLGSGHSGSIVSRGLGEGATNVDDIHVENEVHRHVPDAPLLPVTKIGHASEIRQLVKGHALRNAIILKEVLDAPLGLRDQSQLSDPFAI